MMHEGAPPVIFSRAKKLRKNETPAEKMLWERLSNKQLGEKFRRQHPCYHFILDFYCHRLKLAIEVDGEVHLYADNIEYDKYRTRVLRVLGIRVIRFINQEIYSDLDKVIADIKEVIRQISLISPNAAATPLFHPQ